MNQYYIGTLSKIIRPPKETNDLECVRKFNVINSFKSKNRKQSEGQIETGLAGPLIAQTLTEYESTQSFKRNA